MKLLLPFALLALLAGIACSTSPDTGKACALPQGKECCDGDELGTFSCDSAGNVVCGEGTHLTPSNQCTLPLPGDAGLDGPTCALPEGMDCCSGEILGDHTCSADGSVVCLDGTSLTLSSGCEPPRIDSGPDAPCVLPQGMDCCDGDEDGTFTCDGDGGIVCSPGTRLTPTSECVLPPHPDAGHDASP